VSVKERLTPGILVTKAAANLPQTATANLFTVSGAVLVTGILGQVTSALGATATNLSLGVTGSVTAISTAVAVTSGAVGQMFVPVAAAGVGGAAVFSLAPFVPAARDAFVPFIVAVANITWTTSANDTGQMKWSLWYVPIDAGASVS
jgi:hypothetical protein